MINEYDCECGLYIISDSIRDFLTGVRIPRVAGLRRHTKCRNRVTGNEYFSKKHIN